MRPQPKGKRRARCGLCNNELLLHKATGAIGCVVCDLVSYWPTNASPLQSVWRAALVEDRHPA